MRQIVIDNSEGIKITVGAEGEITGGELKGRKGLVISYDPFKKVLWNGEKRDCGLVGVQLDLDTLAIVSADWIKQVEENFVDVEKEPKICTFKIECAMGTSDGWTLLGITPEQHNMLNDIGSKGSRRVGYTHEEYLNQIHYGKYEYKVEHTSSNPGEYTDKYTVTRVRL